MDWTSHQMIQEAVCNVGTKCIVWIPPNSEIPFNLRIDCNRTPRGVTGSWQWRTRSSSFPLFLLYPSGINVLYYRKTFLYHWL